MFSCLAPIGSRARLVLASAGLSLATAAPAAAITLDDVTVWTGTGAHRAGMVIDWADGSAPAVFGYQFDGAPTGEDMLRAIATDRPELFIKTGAFVFPTFSGRTVFGIGLDRDADGFGITDGTTFTDGIAETDTNNADGAAPTDAGDSYREGWNAAFWGYYSSDGNADWGFAPAGFTDRVLTDGQWDGWAFAPGFAGSAPSVAVPEPSSAALIALGGLVLARRRRR